MISRLDIPTKRRQFKSQLWNRRRVHLNTIITSSRLVWNTVGFKPSVKFTYETGDALYINGCSLLHAVFGILPVGALAKMELSPHVITKRAIAQPHGLLFAAGRCSSFAHAWAHVQNMTRTWLRRRHSSWVCRKPMFQKFVDLYFHVSDRARTVVQTCSTTSIHESSLVCWPQYK